jgi:hypothetical protein
MTANDNIVNLDDISELFAHWEQEELEHNEKVWNGLTPGDQLSVFCYVMRTLHKAEFIDQRSYRGVLYDAFGFDLDSYIRAQVAGFLDIHNSLIIPEKDNKRDED